MKQSEPETSEKQENKCFTFGYSLYKVLIVCWKIIKGLAVGLMFLLLFFVLKRPPPQITSPTINPKLPK